jgi:hypothetical protein
MKIVPRTRAYRPRRLVAALALALLITPARAGILYWDANGGAAGIGGAGTWDTTSPLWAPTDAGIPALTPPRVWVGTWIDGDDATAVFAGTRGAVTLSGTRTAAEVVFDSSGYSLDGGRLLLNRGGAGGTLRLADGVTAKITSALDTPLSSSSLRSGITVTGAGSLTLALPTRFLGTFSISGARLVAGNLDGLGGSLLLLDGAGSRFDTGGLSTVRLGGIRTASRHDLGVSVLELTGTGDLAHDSTFSAGLVAGGLRVGTEAFTTLSLGNTRTRAMPATLGFLHVRRAETFVDNLDLALTSQGLTGVGGESSLLVEREGTLTIQSSSRVTANGNVQVEGGGLLAIEGGAHLSVQNSGTAFGILQIGSSGTGARMTLAGAGTRVFADEAVQLGGVRGSGAAVFMGRGTELVAPVLAFVYADRIAGQSSLQIADGGTARFGYVNTFDGGGAAASIILFGGTLIVGDETLERHSPDVPSTFDGQITGTGGLVRKLGSGVLTLSNETGLFPGRVSVEGGVLEVAPRTLARATVSLVPGARVQVVGGGQLTVGALDGSFDLDNPGGALILEGAGDGTWQGRFRTDAVSILRHLGSGTQTLLGATDGGMTRLGSVIVQSGGVRFSEGRFLLDAPGGAILSVIGAGSAVSLIDGAEVTPSRDVEVINGAALTLSGRGTTLQLLAPVSGRVAGTLSLGGRLSVTDEARVLASELFLNGFLGPGEVIDVSIGSGASMVLDGISEPQRRRPVQFTVDGGTLSTGRFDVNLAANGGRPMFLSDPADGRPALTVGLDASGLPVGADIRLPALRDATSGPGSVRMAGAGVLSFEAAPTITGRLIVDRGQVRLASANDLASLTVVLGKDDALLLDTIAPDAELVVAGLAGSGALDTGASRGLRIASRSGSTAIHAGHLRVGGALSMSGGGHQVRAGDAEAGSVAVRGGTLELRGGTMQVSDSGAATVTVQPGRTNAATLMLTGGAWLDAGPGGLVNVASGIQAASLSVDGSGSRLSAERLVASGETAFVVLAGGAHMDLAAGFTLESGARLVVDRASLTTGQAVSIAPGSRITLSDPLASAGADAMSAPVAWTVQPAAGREGVPRLLSWDVPTVDGASGPGSMAFAGNHFIATLGTAAAHTGRTIVDGIGAVLLVPTAFKAQELIARNGGTLRFGDAGAPMKLFFGADRSIRTDDTGIAQWGNASLFDGTLHGSGHRVDGASTFWSRTIVASGAQVTAAADIFWTSGELAGTLDASAYADLRGVHIAAGGRLTLRDTGLLFETRNDGEIFLTPGAHADIAGFTRIRTGARMEVGSGASLEFGSLIVEGGQLLNRGRVDSALVVTSGGRAMGDGTFGQIMVDAGGTFSPGNSPGVAHTGDVVFGADGRYEVEMSDARGAAGVGFDLWSVTGSVDFAADRARPFVVDLVAMAAHDGPGVAAHFDATRAWRWTVLEADAFIGYDEGDVLLDTRRFQAPGLGYYALEIGTSGDRDTLSIVYAPVPEPASTVLLVGGLAALAAWRRRVR